MFFLYICLYLNSDNVHLVCIDYALAKQQKKKTKQSRKCAEHNSISNDVYIGFMFDRRKVVIELLLLVLILEF